VGKDIGDCGPFLEYVIVSISRSFALKPSQTLTLLADNFKFFSLLLIKGQKNDFANVLRWTREVRNDLQHFHPKFTNAKDMQYFLQLIKYGIISQNESVSVACLQILLELHDKVQNLHELMSDFFEQQNGAIMLCLKAYEMYVS